MNGSVFNAMIEQALLQVHTGFIGKVVSVDGNLATVQPLNMVKPVGGQPAGHKPGKGKAGAGWGCGVLCLCGPGHFRDQAGGDGCAGGRASHGFQRRSDGDPVGGRGKA